MPNFHLKIDDHDEIEEESQGWFRKPIQRVTKTLLVHLTASEEAVAKINSMGIMDHVLLQIPTLQAVRAAFRGNHNFDTSTQPITIRELLTANPARLHFDDALTRSKARNDLIEAVKSLSASIDASGGTASDALEL